MSQDEIEQFFRSLQDGFLGGQLDSLVARCDTPLVVYSISGVVVLHTAEEIVQRMKMYREALLALGVKSGRFALESEDSLFSNRLRATVRADYLGPAGDQVTSSLACYFLVRRDGGLIIEMIEYLEMPLPSDEVDRIVH